MDNGYLLFHVIIVVLISYIDVILHLIGNIPICEMSRITFKYWRIKISAYKFLTENVIRGIVSTCQNESRYSHLVRTLLEVFSKADTLAKSFLKVESPLRLNNFSPDDLVGLDKEKVSTLSHFVVFIVQCDLISE